MQSFAGIVCPQLKLIAVRTPCALFGEPRHHSRLAGGTRGGLERVARIALRNRLALFLNKRNLRACIGRGQRARHTCAPAPITTTSNSLVSLTSLMGSGAWKKLGKPSVSLEAAAGALFDDPPDGEQPASMPAPAAPTAAMPPNLNKSRRESSMISLLLFLVGSPFSPNRPPPFPFGTP